MSRDERDLLALALALLVGGGATVLAGLAIWRWVAVGQQVVAWALGCGWGGALVSLLLYRWQTDDEDEGRPGREP